MDANIAILTGALTAPPELRILATGAVIARYLLSVRTDHPPLRLDVIPVCQWNPPSYATTYPAGTRLVAVGSVQRRYWDHAHTRGSTIEFVADHVFEDADLELCSDSVSPGGGP